MIHSYPSIYNLGHAAIATLLHGPVIVEEKIDGSQISFSRQLGRYREDEDWTPILEIRSKGAGINKLAPEGLFKKAVDWLLLIQDKIPIGYTFRGEYLSKPAHNVMQYGRIPTNHIIIFDIEKGDQEYLSPADKAKMAAKLGLETVPVLHVGGLAIEQLRDLLEHESILGDQKVEGVVIKPLSYDLYGRDKKVLMGKFVSEAFKETHAAEWKLLHGPKSSNDILRELAATYSSPARWQKAVLHLREAGKITDSLRDIGELMKEIPNDVQKECEPEIKEALFKWAWPNLRRSVARGLPEWYKNELLLKQFNDDGGADKPPVVLCEHKFITGEGFASACVKCGNVTAPSTPEDEIAAYGRWLSDGGRTGDTLGDEGKHNL